MNFAVAYNGKTGRGYAINEPFLDTDVDGYADALRVADVLKEAGYHPVVIFSYDGELDEKAVTWDFADQHAVKEPSRQQCIDALRSLRDEIEMWEWDEDYFKSGFQDSEDQTAWALHIVDVVIRAVQNVPDTGGLFSNAERG